MTKLRTVSIKGKAYVTVNDRLKYFRENHAGYSLETEIVQITEEFAVCRAIIRDEKDRLIATGIAREVRTDPAAFVNKTSYVENCETSAWGRALANFGIGIDETVASADEVSNAIHAETQKPVAAPQTIVGKSSGTIPKPTVQKVMESMTESTTVDQVEKLWARVHQFAWTEEDMNTIRTCYINTRAKL
jgi:hypothetical protein